MKTGTPKAEQPDEDANNIIRELLKEPYGCVMCDSGKLRNPKKEHDDDCPYYKAVKYLSGKYRIIEMYEDKIIAVVRVADEVVFRIGDLVEVKKKHEPTNWVGEITGFWKTHLSGDLHICYNGHHYDIKYFKKLYNEPI